MCQKRDTGVPFSEFHTICCLPRHKCAHSVPAVDWSRRRIDKVVPCVYNTRAEIVRTCSWQIVPGRKTNLDLSNKRVLVVDDDREICALITDVLEDEGYYVCPCVTGEAALEILTHEHYHLVLSDIKMPRVTGIDLLLHIRRMSLDTQVILMTAYASVNTAIQAVRGAAFDYLVKPFSLGELRQCVHQALDRETAPLRGVVSIEDLIVDMNARHVWLGEKQVNLTRREFDVLAYLVSQKGRAVPWEELVAKVWNDEPDARTSGTLRSCIRRLRTRLNDDANNPRYIQNIWGVGYRVEDCSLNPPLPD